VIRVTYDKLEFLGKGAFAKVYKVRAGDGELYAMKTLDPQPHILQNVDMSHLKRRFSREVRYQSTINHPNIVRVVDYDLDADPPYCVLELAKCSLHDMLQHDRTLGNNPGPALFDILAALEALSELGYAHRDLKPFNILAFEDNGRLRYAVSDFGLMTAGAANTTTLTGTGAQGGTPNYAAPELISNFRRATFRADIYSFGAILHDIFSGERRIPYTELSVPGPLGPILSRCTKSNAKRRYESIAELREDLFNVLNDESVDFVSNSEEEVVDLLKANDQLTEEQWDKVFEVLDDQESRRESSRNIFRHVRVPHIQQLATDSPELLKALGSYFSDYVTAGSFDFDYCDILSTKLQAFYDVGDTELRASVLVALLEMGTSHNRWVVERRFAGLAGLEADEHIISRFLVENEVRGKDLARQISKLEQSIGIRRESLHTLIQKELH